MLPLVVLADDLSGAAESAAGFLPLGVEVSVCLGTAPSLRSRAGVTVVDLHSRRMSGPVAAAAVHAILDAYPDAHVAKKIDSLLRGNVASEVEALAVDGAPVIVAAGFPKIGRVVEGGIVRVHGVPLHETTLWHAEHQAAPRSVAEALGGLDTAVVTLEQVREDGLASLFAHMAERGRIPLCDTETDSDLDAVVAAARCLTGVRLVGTAALMAALARSLDGRETARPVESIRKDETNVLVVVGTADSGALAQVQALECSGTRHIGIDARTLAAGSADSATILEALDRGDVVITVSGAVNPSIGPSVVDGLARLVAEIERKRPCDLVLTGGETARTVLDRIGVRELEPICEVETGAILLLTQDGPKVITRPGSFGETDSLRILADRLHKPTSPPTPRTRIKEVPMTEFTPLPLVAITLGDGAGVGPEVIVPAVLDPRTSSWCRPVVIGDASRLRLAAEILGSTADIRSVGSVAEAEFVPGRINVIDLDLLPHDLAWGELSAVAGNAAYEYIRVASELAVRGEVQAICTAPLNKEALHAAGHIFPGHTELLAHLTETEEVSMMLSTPKLKVIHVTTHIGLLDAVAKIEPGLVERTIRRGFDALVRSGIANPKIGVCGINPHAGENGLFGYGEEDLKIVPAVETSKADGIDVVGPLPADTAFFLAGRGDYDLIVAMYHDQGHGPVKVLGIEAGVNITVGLPVIRTSVDHGTAFDIAGKGIAEAGSMVEALRQAAELATSTAVLR